VSSPYSDLERPPLSERGLRRALLHEGSVWTELRVLERTQSTNADVAAAARDGVAQGLVVVAEHQDAGRGRLDRSWTSPARAGLTFSVLLRPSAPRATWSWLPLLAGLALQQSLVALTELAVGLKWPNDLLVGGRKLAGVLAEVSGDAVVLGIGVNVTSRPEELPPQATSLAIEESPVIDRDTLFRAALRSLGNAYDGWGLRDGSSAELRSEYAAACVTLGSRVRVTLTGGGVLEGAGDAVDPDGRLLVRSDDGTVTAVSSGDVEHVRSA
jgi:BirA family biotin operon repressor/biotin-[acetyl-CoA-carboxylase] ligase